MSWGSPMFGRGRTVDVEQLQLHAFGVERFGLVQREDLDRIVDLRCDVLAGRLLCAPQLEVLDPVVVTHAVAMVDVLMWQEFTTEVLGHDEAMLHYHLAFYAKNLVAISIYMSSSMNPYRSVKISSLQQSTAMNATHIESCATP